MQKPYVAKLPRPSQLQIHHLVFSTGSCTCVSLTETTRLHSQRLQAYLFTLELFQSTTVGAIVRLVRQQRVEVDPDPGHRLAEMPNKVHAVSSGGPCMPDPPSMQRIEIPARGRECMHLQCFDLRHFIMLNKLSRRAVCPTCNSSIQFQSLITDCYTEQLLAAADPVSTPCGVVNT